MRWWQGQVGVGAVGTEGARAVMEGRAVCEASSNQEQSGPRELPLVLAVRPPLAQLAHFSLEKLRPPKGAGT